MTERSVRAIAAGILVLIILVGGFLYYSKRGNKVDSITSFTECEVAGYQVVATIPPECVTPDGKVFVDTSVTATASPTGIPSVPGGSGSKGGSAGGTSGGTSTSSNATTSVANKIRVSNVSTNQMLTSPFTVKGEARGSWYSEAVFPIELLDGNGKRIILTQARADGDWMTTNFVPFSATLSFAKPKTATGTLILHNDNPSGLPENAFELRIPVRFATSTK
jgi:hypothetical protein